MIYEENQKVKCIIPESYRTVEKDLKGAGWQKDLEFTIERISRDGSEHILWGGYHGNGVYSKWVEHIRDWDSKENQKEEQ